MVHRDMYCENTSNMKEFVPARGGEGGWGGGGKQNGLNETPLSARLAKEEDQKWHSAAASTAGLSAKARLDVG